MSDQNENVELIFRIASYNDRLDYDLGTQEEDTLDLNQCREDAFLRRGSFSEFNQTSHVHEPIIPDTRIDDISQPLDMIPPPFRSKSISGNLFRDLAKIRHIAMLLDLDTQTG